MVSEREALVKKLVVGARRRARPLPCSCGSSHFYEKLFRRREAPVSRGSRITAVVVQMWRLISDALLLHLRLEQSVVLLKAVA